MVMHSVILAFSGKCTGYSLKFLGEERTQILEKYSKIRFVRFINPSDLDKRRIKFAAQPT